jgi:hypothetical protein
VKNKLRSSAIAAEGAVAVAADKLSVVGFTSPLNPLSTNWRGDFKEMLQVNLPMLPV